MNSVTSVCVLVLALIAASVGGLLLTGKVRLVVVRRSKEEEEPPTQETLPEPVMEETAQEEVIAEAAPKKRASTKKKPQPRHLYLPIGVTEDKLHNLDLFFRKYEHPTG